MTLPILADYLANTDYKTLQQHFTGSLFYGAKTPKDAKGQVMRPATTADKSILSNYIFATPNGTVLFNYLYQDYIIDLLDKHNTPYFRYLEACSNVLITNNKVMVNCKTVDKYKTLATPKKIMKHCRAAVTDNKLTTIKAVLQEITNDTKADTTDKIKAIDILCEQLDAMITHCLAEWRQYADYVVFAGFNDGHRDYDKTRYIMHIGLCTIGITREQAEVVEDQGNVPYLNYTVPQLLKQLLLEQKEILQPTEPATTTQQKPAKLTTSYQSDIEMIQRAFIGQNEKLDQDMYTHNWIYNAAKEAKKLVQVTIPNSIADTFKVTDKEQKFYSFMLHKYTTTGTGPLARCKKTRTERHKMPITEEDRTFTFDIMEYANISNSIHAAPGTATYRKEVSIFKKDILTMLANFVAATYCVVKRGGKLIELGHIFDSASIEQTATGTDTTQVTITFGKWTAEKILNDGGSFKLPTTLLLTKGKHAHYVGNALTKHWQMNEEQSQKRGFALLSVDNLIGYPVFNAENKNSTGEKQRPSRQYINPLENALDELVTNKTILTWEYSNAKGEPLTDGQLQNDNYHKFDTWRTLFIKYTIADIT